MGGKSEKRTNPGIVRGQFVGVQPTVKRYGLTSKWSGGAFLLFKTHPPAYIEGTRVGRAFDGLWRTWRER